MPRVPALDQPVAVTDTGRPVLKVFCACGAGPFGEWTAPSGSGINLGKSFEHTRANTRCDTCQAAFEAMPPEARDSEQAERAAIMHSLAAQVVEARTPVALESVPDVEAGDRTARTHGLIPRRQR